MSKPGSICGTASQARRADFRPRGNAGELVSPTVPRIFTC